MELDLISIQYSLLHIRRRCILILSSATFGFDKWNVQSSSVVKQTTAIPTIKSR